MSIFKKQQRVHSETLRRTTDSPARPAENPPTPPASPDQALQRIHAAADAARQEIAALVQVEQKAIGQAIESASGEAEKRLRGATEKRIDLEVKRVEEAGNKLNRDLRRMIRAEISKAAKTGRAKDNHPSVPIRARA